MTDRSAEDRATKVTAGTCMQRMQTELLINLGADKSHRRSLINIT